LKKTREAAALPHEPTFCDVLRARNIVRQYLPETPIVQSRAISKLLDCDFYLKLENLQPVGAFKVRGGINLMSSLSEEQRRRGIIAASTGNHGQSLAYAGHLFDSRVVIVAPRNSNPFKVESMRELGADVVLHGRDFDEARSTAERMAVEKKYRYVHHANEPLLIAGVATETLEILERIPDVDIIIAPIGGGSGASGACIVAKTMNPKIEVVGVQAEKAPAVYLSWKNKTPMSTEESATFAEGLATRVAFELPLQILTRLIDEIVLVSEEELQAAILLLFEKVHQVAEGAGAASTAAAVQMRSRIRGKKVAAILSGGNLEKVIADKLLRGISDEKSNLG